METTTSGNIGLLLLIIFATLLFFLFIRGDSDKEFDHWFEQLLIDAAACNCLQQPIESLEEIDFYEDFVNGLSPKEALTKYTHEKTT